MTAWPKPYSKGPGLDDLLFTTMDQLHFNSSWLGTLGVTRERVHCNYSYIGPAPAKPWTSSYPAIPLEGASVILSPQYNAIDTRCSASTNGSAPAEVSHIVLFYVPSPDLTEKLYVATGDKTGKWVGQPSDQKTGKQYSVATFVIDSLSQMNMFRSLPRSVRQAEAMGGIVFSGHHKVGLNSKPNMMAMASGSVKYEPTAALQPLVTGLYRQLGWKTVYLEDSLHWVGHALRSGAMEPGPWDMTYHDVWNYLGRSANHQSQINTIGDLLMAYKDVPSFIHCHLSEYIHDNLNMGKNYDADLVSMLTRLSAAGALEDTFFLLMGDHGYRQGGFAATKQGVIENNMPALLVIPPINFAKNHPDLYANLKGNAETLTSMFDIHQMLRQVIQPSQPPPLPAGARPGRARGGGVVSLLPPVWPRGLPPRPPRPQELLGGRGSAGLLQLPPGPRHPPGRAGGGRGQGRPPRHQHLPPAALGLPAA